MEWNELNTNKYYDFINNIISTRGQWSIKDNEYFEGHHIIPKAFGGIGDTKSKDNNIIWLYPEEHYEVHKILALDNPKCSSVVYAYWIMCNGVSASGNREIHTGADYALARKLFIDAEKKNKTIYQQEARICPICKTTFYVRSNLSQRYCSNICASKGNIGRQVSEETRQILSQKMSGKNNPNYGKHMLEEQKENLRQKLTKNHYVEKACLGCGKIFKVPYPQRNQKYCTAQCAKQHFKITHTENYSKANKGGNNPNANKIICIETNEIFNCMKDAYTKLGISKSTFSKKLKTNQEIKGCHYEHLDPNKS